MKNYNKNEKERLEILNQKIKENFNTKEDFFNQMETTEANYKKGLLEGNLYLDTLYKTQRILKLTKEETIFLFYGKTLEEQSKFLITEEQMKGQDKEVIEFFKSVNEILKTKSIEGRKIFLNELQKKIESDLKGSEKEWWLKFPK